MNPGAVEEVGKTVNSIVHVLESQPLALAMIISNFALLGYLFYAQIENNAAWKQNNEQRAELGRLVLQNTQETQKLLLECARPKP